MDGWMNEWMYRPTDRRMDVWTDGHITHTDKQTDRHTDRQTSG